VNFFQNIKLGSTLYVGVFVIFAYYGGWGCLVALETKFNVRMVNRGKKG
jgi:hypothetical protein